MDAERKWVTNSKLELFFWQFSGRWKKNEENHIQTTRQWWIILPRCVVRAIGWIKKRKKTFDGLLELEWNCRWPTAWTEKKVIRKSQRRDSKIPFNRDTIVNNHRAEMSFIQSSISLLIARLPYLYICSRPPYFNFSKIKMTPKACTHLESYRKMMNR